MRRALWIMTAGVMALSAAGCPPRDGAGNAGRAVPAPVEIDWPDAGAKPAPPDLDAGAKPDLDAAGKANARH